MAKYLLSISKPGALILIVDENIPIVCYCPLFILTINVSIIWNLLKDLHQFLKFLSNHLANCLKSTQSRDEPMEQQAIVMWPARHLKWKNIEDLIIDGIIIFLIYGISIKDIDIKCGVPRSLISFFENFIDIFILDSGINKKLNDVWKVYS